MVETKTVKPLNSTRFQAVFFFLGGGEKGPLVQGHKRL